MTVDFHSHILPGMDDGSASVEESAAMLAMEAEQGIGRVVLTPHFYPRYDTPQAFLERRAASEARLQQAMAKGLPELIPGAEVHYAPGMSHWEDLPKLTLGKSPYILIEMPPAPWPQACYRELEQIRIKQGLTPIIAHIDRYISPFRTHGIPERLESLPVLVQANAEFFLRRTTAGQAFKLLQADRIHLLGSDCHNLKDRKPNLGAAIAKIKTKQGQPALDKIEKYTHRILQEE